MALPSEGGCCEFESRRGVQCFAKEIQMKTIVEVHSAEGGDDSKLFAKDLAQAYTKMFQRFG